MREYRNLIIIGGGAAGNSLARRIENGEITVIERKEIIGEPAECAGLVSKKSLELMDIDLDESNFIQNRIYGAYIHSPKGEIYQIGGDRLHAYAIDRGRFDRFLADVAKRRGAEYILGAEAKKISREDNKIVVRTTSGEFEADIVVGADGIESIVRKTFFDEEPEEILFGIGAEVEGVEIDPRYVHVFFGKRLTPDFFAWMIPINEKGDKARIGLCVAHPPDRPPKRLLHDLLNYPTTKALLEKVEIINVIAGRIPLGYIRKSVIDNALLIGDSAFQIKPVSGGGIYPIAEASRICAEVLNKALERRNFSEKVLREYHIRWSERLKREILFGLWVRKKYRNMGDEDIERFLSYLKRDDIVEIVNKYGDIDHPSRLILPLTKKFPTMISILPKIVGLFF